ncbi:hypothetical protein [Bradyrhizobium sp. BWA-3-5]|uniref:hypothetical protein n=1 Tax=Bradyrhizobium sp. BWA-3-5 TaxID=3080013 RepID=UPI00293E095B|nr:hypothetical protein [Bradyrhizobium sp. BWA-3-5]WOH63890.1 hypothetical protein RX331_24875 [Bradyrhizobium sp. BWA-3-5]
MRLGYADHLSSQAAHVAPHLGKITAVVHPSPFQQAVVIDLARHTVERFREECT